MAKKPEPPLKLVTATDTTWAEPPRNLDNRGRSLWDRIMREYDIRDAGGLELLLLACEGIDRIWVLRQEIERDGAVIRLRNGAVKEHPALKAEIAAMSLSRGRWRDWGLMLSRCGRLSGVPVQVGGEDEHKAQANQPSTARRLFHACSVGRIS